MACASPSSWVSNGSTFGVTPSWSSNKVMKESSYHNTKMAAYCQEVRQLEDKFDGLELNHILRCLNEVAESLAKTVSGREPVPTGVFASD